MNVLAIRAENAINEMAAILAAYPAPEKWTSKQKAQTIQFAALLDNAQKVITASKLSKINYQIEKKTFVENAGRTQSVNTHIAYRAALGRLDEWANRQNINPLELTPAQADDFIYSLCKERSAASVRLDVAAASSFYTFLHRRHTAIENPFRGTKARPAKKAATVEIPSAGEVGTIIRELPSDLAAAVSIMAYRGLRAGILPTLSIKGEQFKGYSKGKDVSGALPSIVVDAIKATDLSLRGPFAGIQSNTLEKRIARAIAKLYKAGKVQSGYSAHDLRHFYAVTEYHKDKDIHRVSKLLGHASILVTETYLRGLGEVE